MTDLNVAFIKSVMDMFASSPLAELKVRTGELEISMVRRAVGGPPEAHSSQRHREVEQPDTGRIVTAPFPGIVYLSPSPGAPAFAPEGHRFSIGDTLLLCESMKTMTPVPAPGAGEVETVLVEDGAYVEAGAQLLRYRATGP